ncbi:acyltransferase [Mucilaginibacter galii]|uniref:Acyltransferase n=1 Tax=Mucilaginibacter galii TaxID=2005073 RepID=A0A917JBU4_9SPHI|nr:acyltransferase [Mucilaginibacter galii]GGI51206.1 acyltransferase [Mucilaginibacter galii]
MQLKYFKELDGVRGLAAIMVVLFHIKQSGISNDAVARILYKAGNFGQTGVILFFVLSGFLITRILLISKHKEAYFKKFYIRRSLRIFPLYYLALAIFVIVVPYFTTGKVVPFSQSWSFWVYLQNIGFTFKWSLTGPNHFWSLAVEEHFYLVWPFVVYFLSEKWLLRTIGLIVLGSIITRIIMLNMGYAGIFYFTLTTMDCLAIGGFVALNERNKWINVRQTLYIMAATLLLLITNWALFKGEGNDFIQVLKLPFISVFYMCVISLLVSTVSYLNRFFQSSILTYTGKISYGLYVFHPLCILAVEKYFKGQPFIVILALIAITSYSVASISYYGYEYWFLKQKDRFENFTWSRISRKNPAKSI